MYKNIFATTKGHDNNNIIIKSQGLTVILYHSSFIRATTYWLRMYIKVSELGLHLAHQGLQLHGRSEVALDLELPAHEGARGPHLPLEHVHHQLRVTPHRHVGLCVRLALVTRPAVVLEVQQPVARVIAVQDKVEGGVDLCRDLGAEECAYGGKHGCRGIGVGTTAAVLL